MAMSRWLVGAWNVALGLLAALGLAAQAQDTDTLRKIAETGTISLGHRESSVPFSYYDARHRVVGYSQDLISRCSTTSRPR